ncbi:hypothetical protein M9H77_08659 [Catharanthus roseus]|uniref:Uncharacterized protein n=1 Tax=Catharanthus roseus TaxID=4058 RepID=A0ACC0BYL5_CATRO|nr:hypothetical protein M9H77_08659 [Catharanthus roseus]
MSGGNGDTQNVVQDIEALRDRMDAQEAAIRTLEVNLDQRFRRLDQRFDEMINRFDALGVDANRNKNGGQRPRDQLARGGIANVAGYNSSDEEEDLVLAEDQNRPARRGGGRYNNNNYNTQNNNDYYGGDFGLKVDIPSFYGNLGIEDFVDWIVEIDQFFEYMDIPQEKRVKLVRNNLRESEVHQVSRYLDGLKQQIRDRIRVQVVKSVTEAKNLAIKAKLMIRDRGGSRIEETSRSFADRSKAAQGWNQGTEWKEDKGPGKKVAELKEGQKAATNPYAKPILVSVIIVDNLVTDQINVLLGNLLM